jgi:amidase
MVDAEHGADHAGHGAQGLPRGPPGPHPARLDARRAPGAAQPPHQRERGAALGVRAGEGAAVHGGRRLVFPRVMDATDLCFAGAAEQARLVAAGEVSARELVEASLERIWQTDPDLNAFRVVLAHRALTEADQADARRGAGDRRPLLGVPVAIKDDADVAGEVTAWGSLSHGGPKERDSDAVRALRGAGAIVIGKTHVPELTIFPFTESLAFGATRNPWSLDHTPGGSSGGTGAAVAAGMVGVGLGSDGGGSVRIPAAFCGLFGIKPQRDRISLGPKREVWHGLSVFGPLARRVADAALFLEVAAGGGDFAAAAAREPGRLRVAVSTKVPPGALARLGGEQREAVEATAELLRSLGHDVAEREIDYGPTAWLNVTVRYLRGVHDDARGVEHPERLEPRTKAMARLGALVGAGQLARARAAEEAVAARVNAIFDHADVVLTPGPAGAPFRVGQLHGRGALLTLNRVVAKVPYYGVFNVTGQPAASVPAGFDGAGLPLAVQLVGRPGDEATLLSLAAQIEQARPWAHERPPL